MLEKERPDFKPPTPIAFLRVFSRDTSQWLGDVKIWQETTPQGQLIRNWYWHAVNASTGDWGSWHWAKNTTTGKVRAQLVSEKAGRVVISIFKESWNNGPLPPREPYFQQMPVNGYTMSGDIDDGTMEIEGPSGKKLMASWY